MDLEPIPGMRLKINGEDIEFTALDGSEYVYSETGKEATVFRVLKGGEYYALKVFNPAYQNERLTKNSLELKRFSSVSGLRVAQRTVITKKDFSALTKTYPSLEYAILMPWIQGALWGNLMANGHTLQKQKYVQIAGMLMQVICNLESRNLAHCDLSNNNFIIDPTLNSIELIDIENMYASEMPRPIPDISYGTPGYRSRWIAEKGIWEPIGDRFASSILCAEILSWSNKEIQENRADDSESYFSENDIGTKSDRFLLMQETLNELDPILGKLFHKAWFSKSFEDCPPVCEWKEAVDKLEIVPSTVKKRAGKPPQMTVSQTILDFGTVEGFNHPSLDLVISNDGGSTLEGSISSESWISASLDHFSLNKGEKAEIGITLQSPLPAPQGKLEYRTPAALVIESNAGTEVVGATFLLPKPRLDSQVKTSFPEGTASATTRGDVKKRGGCLTTWLVVVMISDFLAIFISLPMMGNNSSTSGYGGLLLFLSVIQLISAGAILNWKKWGVYIFGMCIALGTLTVLSLGDTGSAFLQLLVQSLLLYFLVKPAWKFMD